LAVSGGLLRQGFSSPILALVVLAPLALVLISRAIGGPDARHAVADSITNPMFDLAVGAGLPIPSVLHEALTQIAGSSPTPIILPRTISHVSALDAVSLAVAPYTAIVLVQRERDSS
jgi:hypothetical protein